MRRKRTVGIYLIRNNTTGRVYVGQSKHIEKRNRQELIRKMINRDFINDLEIYGLGCFSCSTLEVLSKYDKQLLNERERFYIAFYNSDKKEHGYNKNHGTYKTYEEQNELDSKRMSKPSTINGFYLKQKKKFVYLDGVVEIVENPILIKDKPKRHYVSFTISDDILNKNNFTTYELRPYYIKRILERWVENKEKNEKRRLKAKERAERQKKGER